MAEPEVVGQTPPLASRTVSAAMDSSSVAVPPPLTWPPKDPDETLDYGLDWTGRLEGDSIETSEWLQPAAPVPIVTAWYDGTRSKIWLRGGDPGATYFVVNKINTTGGCTMRQTVKITIIKSR
jgi:hypothetical protein